MKGYDIEFAKLIRKKINTQISFVGGACSQKNMEHLIESIGVAGLVAGSMFVFKGKFRAVLLSYERPNSIIKIKLFLIIGFLLNFAVYGNLYSTVVS